MCALTEEVRRLDKRVAAHVHGTHGVLTSIVARVTTIELCSFWQPSGIRYEPELGRRIADAGIYVCSPPLPGYGQVVGAGPRLTMGRVTPRAASRAWQPGAAPGGTEVQIVSGSDAGVSCNTFADYPGDLLLMVEGVGLSSVDVLKSATSMAAEALGHRDLGVLAPGKVADVLAVQGNPLHNIRALNAPRLVVSRGRVVMCIPGTGAAGTPPPAQLVGLHRSVHDPMGITCRHVEAADDVGRSACAHAAHVDRVVGGTILSCSGHGEYRGLMELSPNITAELNAQEKLIGIEILQASTFVHDSIMVCFTKLYMHDKLQQ